MLQDILKYEPINEQEETDKKLILMFNDQKALLNREFLPAHYTASSLIVNESIDKVLFVYHNIYKSWSWTGGHCDGDDDFLNVAYREAIEETSIKELKPLTKDILALDVIMVPSHIKRGKYVSDHLHLNLTYVFIGDEHADIKMKADENSGVAWIKIDELDKYVSEEHMLPIYNKIIERAKEVKKNETL